MDTRDGHERGAHQRSRQLLEELDVRTQAFLVQAAQQDARLVEILTGAECWSVGSENQRSRTVARGCFESALQSVDRLSPDRVARLRPLQSHSGDRVVEAVAHITEVVVH